MSTPQTMQILDTAQLPLSGQQLIEASAGTGKTYAITTLYLRLLLETPRTIRDILVVTFTRAATDELRRRLRDRLVEAIGLLRAPAALDTVQDPGLQAVLRRAAADCGMALGKLEQALAGVDEAAVHTIHAFCQRALRDHAFESGALFDAELTENEQALRERAIADWWRARFYSDPALARLAAGSTHLATPAALGNWLRDVLSHDLRLKMRTVDPAATGLLCDELRTRWADEGAHIRQTLEQAKNLKRTRNRELHPDFVAGLAALDEWSTGKGLAPLPKAARKLSQREIDAMVTDARRKQGEKGPAIDYAGRLEGLLDDLDALELQLLAEARSAVLKAVDERKRETNVQAFDDLVQRLREALAGEHGAVLAGRLAERYPAALIDEFQDTDPAQYEIFRRVYQPHANTCLLLIGDPKQAIYSFRGADIYAYVRARRETADAQRHTMDTNWRSSAALVKGVNTLFGRVSDAFLMGADIEWITVRAAGRADEQPLHIQDQRPIPLQIMIPDGTGTMNKQIFRERVADAVAERCALLLNGAARGEVVLEGRALVPRDIAVLVRSHHEAGIVQRALQAFGLGSALASQDSVFESIEAQDLACVLAALAQPGNERLLRRALVCPLWGYTAARLIEATDNQRRWDALLEQVHGWHQIWVSRGVTPMLRTWLHQAGIPAALLARPGGERALTNLLHLGELLQQAAREQATPDALLRWLQRAIDDPTLAPGEARQLRLESDENLVQVVTTHKSKGLEYPVVFLPFIGIGTESGTNRQRETKPVYHDPLDNFALTADYQNRETALDYAGREALAEQMRLLYVALTRARYLCGVGWGAAPGFSALARLLLYKDGDSLQTIKERHKTLCEKNEGGHQKVAEVVRQIAACAPDAITVMSFPAGTERYASRPPDASAWRVRAPVRGIDHAWRVTSFSALSSQSPDQTELVARLPVGGAREDASVTEALPGDDIAAFPRGTRAGHFFHELLEELDFPAAQGPALDSAVRHQCERHGIPLRWANTVGAAVQSVLDTPLAEGLRLRTLDARSRRNECEFYYPVARLNAQALESAVPGLASYQADTPRFTFSPVSGLMHGFIDLVFAHAGRWYVADWKTNWLGLTPAAYTGEALAGAMRHHAYDLQYWVYTVALHRHLQQKLGERYDYDQHAGGVYYFFLRGMQPALGMRAGVFFDKPPRAQLEALDALLRGDAT